MWRVLITSEDVHVTDVTGALGIGRGGDGARRRRLRCLAAVIEKARPQPRRIEEKTTANVREETSDVSMECLRGGRIRGGIQG